MKLKQLLFQHATNTIEEVQRSDIAKLERRVLTQLELTYPDFKTKAKYRLPLMNLGFGILCFSIFVLGFALNQKSFIQDMRLPISISPVQAAVNDISQSLSQPLSYTLETTMRCDTWNFDAILKDESGRYEANAAAIKQKTECEKSDGVFKSYTHFSIDPQQKAIRKEVTISEWEVAPPMLDKNGQLHTGSVEPVQIQKDDAVYNFLATAIPTSSGEYEGLYIESSSGNPMRPFNHNLTRVSELPSVQSILDMYQKAPDNTTATEESTENGVTYTVLKQLQDGKVVREDWFKKDTKEPYISKEYNDSGTLLYEVAYKDFSRVVAQDAFDLNKPPKGYRFITGSLKNVSIRALDCETCSYGDTIEYDIMPISYINSDGKEVTFPAQQYNLVLNPPFTFSVSEANADKTQFKPLGKVTKSAVEQLHTLSLGSVYKSLYTIGETQETTIKVESVNVGTKETTTFDKTLRIPYTATKLEDHKGLKFRYVQDYGDGRSIAVYTSSKHPRTLIAFMHFVPDALCQGYRDEKVCSQTTENGFTTSIVKEGNMPDKPAFWWRSDIVYKDMMVTIQFRDAENMPDEAKQEILSEAKELLETLQNTWE